MTRTGFTCLIQISSVFEDFIIDCIKLHKHVSKALSALFLSQNITKVFHGCDNDLKWLKADFEIDVVNLFDTAKAMMIINGNKAPESLSYLTNRYLHFYMDKSYQQADWRVRPLPKKMLEYARMDSCVLLMVWFKQRDELDKISRVELEKKMAKKCWRTLEKSNLVKVSVEYEA